jgi:hypothetical protein
VKRQRAYFAEVDAFELPVEEVSESEVEWKPKLIPEYMAFRFCLYRSNHAYNVRASLSAMYSSCSTRKRQCAFLVMR